VTFNTLSQKLLGKGNKLRELGLDVLMIPDGLSTTTTLVGKLPKSKIDSLRDIVDEKISMEESEELPALMNGIPDPPSKCNMNPLASGCSVYLSSDDWMYIPVVGFKRRATMLKNPKSIFKNNVIPGLKSLKDTIVPLFKKRNGIDEKQITGP
jgi:hypothetical protein